MKTIWGFLALIFFSITNNAQTPAIATQRFEPYDSYSQGEIAQEYRNTRRWIANALNSGMKKATCQIEGKAAACLVKKGKQSVPISPFVPYRSYSSYGITRGWVPLSAAYRGKQTLREWQRYADSGQLLSCAGEDCEIIVNTPNKGLARCRIAKMKTGELTTPKYCNLIAVVENGTFFVTAIVGLDEVRQTMGRKDFDLTIRGKVTKDRSHIEEILMQALAERPLNLSVEREWSGDILGTASYRTSEILTNWREIVTIRVKLIFDEPYYLKYGRNESTDSLPFFMGIESASTLYVNRQNSDRRSDWTLPSEAQESLWIAAVMKSIKNYASKFCQEPHWSDAKTLECMK